MFDDLGKLEEALGDFKAEASFMKDFGLVSGAEPSPVDAVPAAPRAARDTRPQVDPVPVLDEIPQVVQRSGDTGFGAEAMRLSSET